LYEKIRVGHQVKNLAVAVVIGLDEDGKRDILAIEPIYEESETTCRSLFDNLKERGLKKVWLVVSDAHKGWLRPFRNLLLAAAGNAAKYTLCGTYWLMCRQRAKQSLPTG